LGLLLRLLGLLCGLLLRSFGLNALLGFLLSLLTGLLGGGLRLRGLLGSRLLLSFYCLSLRFRGLPLRGFELSLLLSLIRVSLSFLRLAARFRSATGLVFALAIQTRLFFCLQSRHPRGLRGLHGFAGDRVDRTGALFALVIVLSFIEQFLGILESGRSVFIRIRALGDADRVAGF